MIRITLRLATYKHLCRVVRGKNSEALAFHGGFPKHVYCRFGTDAPPEAVSALVKRCEPAAKHRRCPSSSIPAGRVK
jgi:hypothetical protein